MSNYSAQAATYATKVTAFKAAINQTISELSNIESRLSDISDSALKSNIISQISSVQAKLDSLISEASATSSKLTSKAYELDEEERRLNSLNIKKIKTLDGEEEKEEVKEKTIEVELTDKDENKKKNMVSKALDVDLNRSNRLQQPFVLNRTNSIKQVMK